MRFVLASTFVPFINGGARFIVEWLEQKLLEYGHEVERFYLPFVEDPETLLAQTAALRMIDLSDAGDRLIAVRPPAHVLQHPHKILWFIHHIRAYYDLWGSPYCPPPTAQLTGLRDSLRALDTHTLGEAQRIYTNSQVVSARLKTFNGLASTPLYPPIFAPERFHNAGYGEEIVVVCRMEPHKRQHLLIEAMTHTRSGVKLRLCGRSAGPAYVGELRDTVSRAGLQDRVIIDERWISEEEKVQLLSTALAAAYAPVDEDSYGYPSLEAAHAAKAVISTSDAGGVLELVEDGRNGFICDPRPEAVAEAFDALFIDRKKAARMGAANQQRLRELRIDWDRIIEAFTA